MMFSGSGGVEITMPWTRVADITEGRGETVVERKRGKERERERERGRGNGVEGWREGVEMDVG